MIPFEYNDGGRKAAGYKGSADDCVTRAIATASNQSYQVVYEALNQLTKEYVATSRTKAAKKLRGKKAGASVRNGTVHAVYHKYMQSIGAVWVPTMFVGQGCKTHLRADELPATGKLVVNVSKHLTAVIDGVLHDTYDCSRDGTRCVYGYYILKTK